MASNLTAITLFAPLVASNAIFSARRFDRAMDTMSENPLYGVGNMDIAAAQVVKGTNAVDNINKEFKCSTENFKGETQNVLKPTNATTKAVKSASFGTRLMNGISNVINFTAKHINGVICLVSGFNVIGSEDKTDTAAREILKLGFMFPAEALSKRLIGMTYTKNVNGVVEHHKYDGLLEKGAKSAYEKFLTPSQKAAVTKFCRSHKFAKYIPGAVKGGAFVASSILGYTLGEKIGNALLGEKTNNVPEPVVV